MISQAWIVRGSVEELKTLHSTVALSNAPQSQLFQSPMVAAPQEQPPTALNTRWKFRPKYRSWRMSRHTFLGVFGPRSFGTALQYPEYSSPGRCRCRSQPEAENE